mgnify:CR=1 FL=1
MKRKPENIEVEQMSSKEERWEAVYGFDNPKGVDLVVGGEENVIKVDFKEAPYPQAGTPEYDRAGRLLLEAMSRHPSNLKLPTNDRVHP